MFSSRRIGAAVACVAAASMAVPAASVAGVKVKLRVEGATKTLVEKTVSAGPAELRATTGPSRGKAFPCDVVNNGGSGGAGATPITALARAKMSLGLNWYPEYTGFLVESVGREKPADPRYWDFWVNGKGAADLEYLGGCQLALKKGDSVVWAVTDGSESLLNLSSSGRSAAPRVTVRATNGSTGEPVAGASVGGRLTGADGTATFARPPRGALRLEATAAGYIRSNTVVVARRR